MKRAAILSLALAAAWPALAQTVPSEPDAARALAQNFAVSMDADRDGEISAAEMVAFSDQVFVSLDADGSGDVSVSELQTWEFGMGDIAAFRGREQAYMAVIALVHDIMDADKDGVVSAEEHREGILVSRDRSDVNRDGRLETEEFLRNFIYSMAMRSALQP